MPIIIYHIINLIIIIIIIIIIIVLCLYAYSVHYYANCDRLIVSLLF